MVSISYTMVGCENCFSCFWTGFVLTDLLKYDQPYQLLRLIVSLNFRDCSQTAPTSSPTTSVTSSPAEDMSPSKAPTRAMETNSPTVEDNACPNSLCAPGVECTTDADGMPSCGECPPGFVGNGSFCDDVDECQANNESSACDAMVECFNTEGGYSCGPCPEGFYGDGVEGCRPATGCTLNNGGCDSLTSCSINRYTGAGWNYCPCRWYLGWLMGVQWTHLVYNMVWTY